MHAVPTPTPGSLMHRVASVCAGFSLSMTAWSSRSIWSLSEVGTWTRNRWATSALSGQPTSWSVIRCDLSSALRLGRNQHRLEAERRLAEAPQCDATGGLVDPHRNAGDVGERPLEVCTRSTQSVAGEGLGDTLATLGFRTSTIQCLGEPPTQLVELTERNGRCIEHPGQIVDRQSQFVKRCGEQLHEAEHRLVGIGSGVHSGQLSG